MREVAVIGGGDLGGACAHLLARRDLARTITLIDEHGRIAAGKALDIAQAAPVEGFATELRGDTDISRAAAADVVVIADRFTGGEWRGDDALVLLRRLAASARRAIVVCAGVGGRDLVDMAVRDVKMPRQRLIGAAPEAIVGAAKALVGLALDESPRDVSLSALGVPPAHIVIPWHEATSGGFALTDLLSEPARRDLDARIRACWPPGPFALAAATAKVVSILAGRSRQLACCFVAPENGGGLRTRTGALPVRLGPTGVREVVLPALSGADRVALENAILL